MFFSLDISLFMVTRFLPMPKWILAVMLLLKVTLLEWTKHNKCDTMPKADRFYLHQNEVFSFM